MNPTSAISTLPSGRSVVVQVDEGTEELLVHAPNGAVEIRIAWTAEGAVVRLGAARLELAAPEIALKCGSLAIDASGTVGIRADEFRVETTRSIHLNGETVRLNCTEDAPTSALVPVIPATSCECHPPDSPAD